MLHIAIAIGLILGFAVGLLAAATGNETLTVLAVAVPWRKRAQAEIRGIWIESGCNASRLRRGHCRCHNVGATTVQAPVGPNAEDVFRAQTALNDDEEWRCIACLDNEAYAAKMLGLMGFDYYH